MTPPCDTWRKSDGQAFGSTSSWGLEIYTGEGHMDDLRASRGWVNFLVPHVPLENGTKGTSFCTSRLHATLGDHPCSESRNLHDKISIKYKHVRCALGSGDDMQNIQALDEFKGVSENGNFELTARDSNTLPRPLSILDLSVPVNQRSQLRVAYQGVPGAFSEDAAAKAYPKCEAVPCEQFETAFEAVELWLVDRAVLPIENSLGGSIHRNYDLLLRHKLHIVGEVQFPVHHCLLGVRGVKKEELRRVLSHPQALSQCEHTLLRLGVIREAVDDTAGAAQFVAHHKLYDTGAVASARAAEIYGLDILAKDIQDVSDNVTRFLMLAREPIIPRVDRPFKTSIVFTLEEGPGVLFKALAVFAMREINLTK
ncbi:hypothetical protein KI387_003694, partial [Taxus chinensis]